MMPEVQTADSCFRLGSLIGPCQCSSVALGGPATYTVAPKPSKGQRCKIQLRMGIDAKTVTRRKKVSLGNTQTGACCWLHFIAQFIASILLRS